MYGKQEGNNDEVQTTDNSSTRPLQVPTLPQISTCSRSQSVPMYIHTQVLVIDWYRQVSVCLLPGGVLLYLTYIAYTPHSHMSVFLSLFEVDIACLQKYLLPS